MGDRRVCALILSLGLTLLGGCVALPVNDDRAAFATTPSLNAVPRARVAIVPADTLLLDVRLDRQVAPNGCGAHAVASVLDYWTRAGGGVARERPPNGIDIYARSPPSSETGYGLGDVAILLQRHGLVALAVQTTTEGVKEEVKAGRPPLVRVSLPASYLRTSSLFPSGAPLFGALEATATDLAARILAPVPAARLAHYWVVIGYDAAHLIVMDPVLGIRAVQAEGFTRAFERGGNLAVVVGGWA